MLIFPPKDDAQLFVHAVLTEHGETRDLGGLLVYVYPEDDLRTYLEARKAAGKREQERLTPVVQEAKRVQEQAEVKTRAAYELMVSAIDDKPKRDEYQKSWERALDASLKAKKHSKELEFQVQLYDWGAFYFDGISSPKKFEAPPSGRFVFDMPAGRYVLGAAPGISRNPSKDAITGW